MYFNYKKINRLNIVKKTSNNLYFKCLTAFNYNPNYVLAFSGQKVKLKKLKNENVGLTFMDLLLF